MTRFLVVVPRDQPEVYDELTQELSGLDVGVVVDRRRVQRRQRWIVARPAERRCTERRGTPGLPAASPSGAEDLSEASL